MGRELKCPICLSLLNSAVSLTCNHVFCNSCILKSMKSGSNCPVCKVPYRRREIRASPHMDSLVSIYKNMEAASGFQIFVTQNPSSTKLSDENKRAEDGTNSNRENVHRLYQDRLENQKTSKRKGSRKTIKSNLDVSDSIAAKPAFPTKKRVQVPQHLPSETPTRPDKLEMGTGENIGHGFKNISSITGENPVTKENGEPVLAPFFWLRDEEDIEKLSQHTIGSQLLDITPPNIPTFSDIKDSDNDNPSQLSPTEEVCGKSNDADLFDSEMFEWTQRACSPELFSSPSMIQDENAGDIDGIQENKQEALLLSSNTNEHRIENEKCFDTEHVTAIAGDELPNPSPLRPKSSGIQIAYNRSKKRGRTAGEATLRKCAKKYAEKDFKVPSDAKTKSRKIMQKEAPDNMGNSSNITKTKSKAVFSTAATETKTKNVPLISLRAETLNLGDRKMAAELRISQGKNQIDNGNLGKRKICGKVSTKDKTDCALRSKKRKPNSSDIDMVKEICTVQNPVEEDTRPSDIGDRSISGTKPKCQKHGKEVNSELSSESNQKLRRPKTMKVSLYGISEDGLANDHQERCNGISAKETEHTEKATDVPLKQTQISEKVTNVSGKETQSTEKVQGSLSRILDNSVTLGKLRRANGVALRACQTLAQKIQCAFCLSSEDTEASGEMVHYYNGRPVVANYNAGSKVIHSHRNCAEWAPNVYFEDDTAINLEAELTRSRRMKCCCCGLKGAALGCYEKSCRKSFHVPCAKMMPQCRWDTDNFVMLCPLHTFSKLPTEESESQERIRKKCIPKRQNPNKCNQVVFKHDASTHPSWNWSATPKKLILCCSALTVEERELVSEFQRLSGATVLKNWNLSVTHVIVSTDENGAFRRTLKILMGILEGKWILNIQWIKACMKAMKPVQEDQYEVMVDTHGIRDGPQLGRLRILNKRPKLFEGFKFYLMGDFVASYKGYIQDLLVAGGGSILHRKPISGGDSISSLGSPSPSTFVIYSLELPGKCDLSRKDMILNRRRSDAEALASATGAKAVSNSWILNSIAACKLQVLLNNGDTFN
ncbi:hypothetical protein JCGZ_04671 [Jatropha curcas]|uniref:RING-type E3 ubiquitin transferase BRCA1 n=2 Tax=Jatropha curcas TaxID=180498 RepID=A0A067KSP6_JATCU|nr:hypothetical protein JCGZ_04671 [Jatropha curcas]